MRVTSNSFPETLVNQLGRLALRQNRLQAQAATGQRVELPEDDPSAMRRVLDLQAESRRVEQYRRNIGVLQEGAQAAYAVLKGLKKISDRANEIAVLADGTKSPEQLTVYAGEITQLIKQAAELANTKHRGDHLFAGTKTNQPPFVVTANAAGQVTAVTYQGNTSIAESEIAENTTLSVQTPGANASGAGPTGLLADSRSGADLFAHLISLQNNLLAGNTTAIQSTDKAQLLKDEDHLILQMAGNGAVQSRLEATENLARSRTLTLESQVSKEADADLAQTLVRLTETQNAYRAALQSGGTILNKSLLDFLR
jgi:flagellar hook-associated protein 3 FlgL